MNPEASADDLRPEYDFDFSKAVREKYYAQYQEGSNVVVLDRDLAPLSIPRKPVTRHCGQCPGSPNKRRI